MHDDLTGTSLVEAYRYSASDLALSLNELDQELEAAVGAVATSLDLATSDTPLVLFNALGSERCDVVEIVLPGSSPQPDLPRRLRPLRPRGSLAVATGRR